LDEILGFLRRLIVGVFNIFSKIFDALDLLSYVKDVNRKYFYALFLILTALFIFYLVARKAGG
jgi:hypothetical protein